MSEWTTSLHAIICINMLLVLLLAGTSFAIVEDPYMGRREKVIMLIVCLLALSLVVQCQLDYMIDRGTVDPGSRSVFVRTLVDVYGYSVRPAILVLFIALTGSSRRLWIFWSVVALNFLIYASSLFGAGLAFRIGEDGSFSRGPLGYACFVISFVLILDLLYRSFSQFMRVRRFDIVIPVFIVLVILAASIGDMTEDVNPPITYLAAAIVACSLFYYLWIHIRLVREHERSLLAEQRIQIMISQIQPHFLYNTLSTIQALCSKDPETAARTVEKFGDYLRQNLASLSQSDLIPFRKEIEHTRIYTEIELLMFPNIRVEYHTDDNRFLLPALTIQPLVENSIRHGVRGKKDGLVCITTRKDGDFHEIVIEDNGKGFDTDKEFEPGRSHIGIKNVRERVEKMCGGTLDVESEIGKGTTVTIRIPVRKETA
ncbi:MAG: histidine kinase [Lachnospiraceae bacterium]|nr:histidine kinase [Lachnospiraceae bacterium]